MTQATFLDALKKKMKIKTDGELSTQLNVSTALVSKIRSGKDPISSDVLLRAHDASGLSIQKLRELAAP